MSPEPLNRGGSASQFAAAIEEYRSQIRAHCYRLVGSHHTAEDLVQETFIRAWCARATFEGRSTLRTWLYRIATNVCLDVLRRDGDRVQLIDAAAMIGGLSINEAAPRSASPAEHLLVTTSDCEPEAAVVAKETVALAVLAVVQYLPPRQRAVLILRDGLGWTARETAQAIDTTVAAANSALQRARATLNQRAGRGLVGMRLAPTPVELEALTCCLGVLTRYTDMRAPGDALSMRALLGADG